MNKIKSLFLLTLYTVFFVLCIDLSEAFARPGGGHSFKRSSSSSSRSSRSSSSGSYSHRSNSHTIYVHSSNPDSTFGGSAAVIFGLFGFIVFAIGLSIVFRKNGGGVVSAPTQQNRSNRAAAVEAKLNLLLKDDPNFSKISFFDFVLSIYNKFYIYQNTTKYVNLQPFIADYLNDTSSGISYREVVVGNIIISNIQQTPEFTSITVDIEANLTKVTSSKSTRYAIGERLLFSRKRGVTSAQPEKMRDLHCPNCGAPASFNDSGTCSFCGTNIVGGQMQWWLAKKSVLFSEIMESPSLASYEEEEGTNYPSVRQKGLERNFEYFAQTNSIQNANEYAEKFKDKVKKYFIEIYNAWSANQWNSVRHLLSDRLFENNQFWIDLYKKNSWQNKLDQIRVHNVEIVKIELDKFYESLTVRIFASCLDYTIDRSGRILGGSNKKTRNFTEYWTFIRRKGVEAKQSEYSLHNCPNCGAPADKMGQAAECGYCGAKISNGDFSWVVTLIIQDEVYEG